MRLPNPQVGQDNRLRLRARLGRRRPVNQQPSPDVKRKLVEDDLPILEGFSAEEELLLGQHLRFYRSLEKGERTPTTDAQRHFIAVCAGRFAADTVHEKTYAKYMRLRPKEEPRDFMDFRDRYDREH